MTTENLDRLNLVLKLKQLRREGPKLLKGRERDDFNSTREKFDKQRVAADALYRAEYKVRVEIARRYLINNAGSKKRDFKPAFGMRDRFNSGDLTRQAQLNVRSDHQRTLDRLDRMELNESEGFLEKCSQRKRYLREFQNSTERRQDQSRRHAPDRRRSPSPSMSD